MLEMKFIYQRFTLDHPPFPESPEGKEMQDYIEYLERTSGLMKSYSKITSSDNLSYTVFKTFDDLQSVHTFSDLIRLRYPNFWTKRAEYIKEKRHQLIGISNYKMFPIANTSEFTDKIFIR
jgi:hypothetical protein